MLLTKKSLKKILTMTAAYFFLGCLCLTVNAIFSNMGIPSKPLTVLGIIIWSLCLLMTLWGFFAEGKSKTVSMGIKLIRRELKPGEFISRYELLKASDDLIIDKPCFEILQLLVTAYDLQNDEEAALKAADEMIAAAKGSKKTAAALLKVSVLFSFGKRDEAEELFNRIKEQKLNITCTALVDVILNTDRAKAFGEFKTAEAYLLQSLKRRFPKPDRLEMLVSHYTLGEIYDELKDFDAAAVHYRYCAENGGETALKHTAAERLRNMIGGEENESD